MAADEPEWSAWFFAIYDRHFMVAFSGMLAERSAEMLSERTR
jgi:hypothetical protein